MVEVLPILKRHGLMVSTMKHAHHRFDVDKPGKDSFRHREAGRRGVLVVTSSRWVLMHESRDEPEPKQESSPDIQAALLIQMKGRLNVTWTIQSWLS